MLPQSLRTNTAMALFQIGPGSALTGVAPWQTGGTGPLLETRPGLQKWPWDNSIPRWSFISKSQNKNGWNETRQRKGGLAGTEHSWICKVCWGWTSLVAEAFAAVFFRVRLCPRGKVDLIYPEYKIYQRRLVFMLESVGFRFESQFATMYFLSTNI